MPFISFMYRVGKNPRTYYGKCCLKDISDDHEGLDREVKFYLTKGLNAYRQQNNKPKLKSNISIGVLSFSSCRYIPTYSSNKEVKFFDFYMDYDNKIYINGKSV